MKYTIFYDKNREEEAIIHAHEPSELTSRLEALLRDSDEVITCYGECEILRLSPTSVACFAVEDGTVVAVTEKGKFKTRLRLYQLRERLSDDFLLINQSCIVNINQIERFETSIGGALTVRMRCGYCDYVSRRQLKAVRERLGI